MQILVSDELGGEGRNFQHAAVETFNVFEKSIGPIEFRLTGLRDELSSAVARGAHAIETLQPTMRQAIAAAESEDDELMDAALQLSQDEFEEGKEIAESIQKAPWQEWQAVATGWARELGMICEPQADGTMRVQVKPDQMQVEVKGINPLLQAGIYGAFSRTQALLDENIHLFGPGHPFFNTLEVLVDKSWLGRACIWKRNLGPANGRIYSCFHIVYDPNFAVLADRKHRATAELTVLRHYQPGSSYIAFALPNLDHPQYDVVDQNLIRQMLDRSSSIGPLSVLELSKLGAPDFAYRLMKKVEQAQEMAIAELRRLRGELVTEMNEKLAHDVQSTVDALRDRIEKHEVADSALEELECWSAAAESIRTERLRVDGIQIVFTPKK